MKRISSLLLTLAYMGVSLTIEAKQVELYFNQTVQEDFVLNAPIDDQALDSPWQDCQQERLYYCQRLTVENNGSEILEGCLPFVNQHLPMYTLDELKKMIAEADQPLLVLNQLWHQSLILDPNTSNHQDHPLYLMNVEGTCNSQDYVRSFAHLCFLLDIPFRPAAIHGKECYDFYCQEKWHLFDPIDAQHYLDLDNHSLVSSEEVMDDPFLALRTKPNRLEELDLKKACETLANFEILTPCIGEEESPIIESDCFLKKQGFTLHPTEQLIYYHKELSKTIHAHQIVIEHLIDVQARQQDGRVEYSAPFPIKMINNQTDAPVKLIKEQMIIQPGEQIVLPEGSSYHLELEVDECATGKVSLYCSCASRLFPTLVRGVNHLHLGTDHNPTTINCTYDLNDELEKIARREIKVVNPLTSFDYCSPFFQLETPASNAYENIWWQISTDPQFLFVPMNFEQVEPFATTITLHPITETFFNSGETYYFRVKGCSNGQWENWSNPFVFTIQKPKMVAEIQFEKIDSGTYEIRWEGQTPDTEYLIFGSNSLDFIPSIYFDWQINSLLNGQIIDQEPNENLVGTTYETKWVVDSSLAYYRLIARKNGQLSVPSPIIHVYDDGLIQPRNVLQVIDVDSERKIVQRTELPHGYAHLEPVYSPIPMPVTGQLFATQFFRSQTYLPVKAGVEMRAYTQGKHVNSNVWQIVHPYLLPENHPIKSKLDRMFSAARVILNPESFKNAGFTRYKQGRFSRIMASPNPKLPGYFIKAFPDCELNIREDWKKLIHRIEGTRAIQQSIASHGYGDMFKSPNKWLYPLPDDPSPPRSDKYARKNFILVAEQMKAYSHEDNEKRYYKKMDRRRLDAFYTLLNEVGLSDSVFAFNVPFCRDDGKMAFIDTEYHHRWPVPFHKVARYLSPEMEKYWRKLIATGGPKPK